MIRLLTSMVQVALWAPMLYVAIDAYLARKANKNA